MIMKPNRTYEDNTHLYGRIWILTALVLIFSFPIAACVYYDAWPGWTPVLKGLLGVAPIFWTVGLIEVITFVPMLGTAGSYLAFVTGNLTNLKVPAALTAMENMDVKPGSEEGEVVSTIAVATSSIVTTIIIAIGVALLVPLTPILNSPVLKPAFDNILPALFGGLAVVYVSKNWKISIAPLVFMVVLFLLVPSLSGSVGVLVPVGALIAMGSARILYKKGKL
ncbi:putative membrane protein [Clostridium sp. D5]|nr:putative membrane protein [Clostridium sp. D5]